MERYIVYTNNISAPAFGNKESDEDVEIIVQYLATHNNLHSLNLSNNKIGSIGASSLTKALAKNTSLTKLDISHNLIDDNALADILELVRQNPNITEINLEDNLFRSSLSEIYDQLENNQTLLRNAIFHFYNNEILSEEEIETLKAHGNNAEEHGYSMQLLEDYLTERHQELNICEDLLFNEENQIFSIQNQQPFQTQEEAPQKLEESFFENAQRILFAILESEYLFIPLGNHAEKELYENYFKNEQEL